MAAYISLIWLNIYPGQPNAPFWQVCHCLFLGQKRSIWIQGNPIILSLHY